MSTIPASEIVVVNPGVLSVGGGALDLLGLFLSTNARVPIGTVRSFSNAAAVSDFFGPGAEADNATVYFNGFRNKTKTPGALLFAQYPAAAVAAYLWGGDMSGLSLANLQALNGTLIMTVDGSEQTGVIDLSSATSFSAAAALIETAMNTTTSVTGSIAANVAVGRIDPNVGTGSIAGTTMTISAVTTGAFAPSQAITGANVAAGTTIVGQLTGTAGSTGTYEVSISQTVPSTTLTGSGGCLNVGAITTGTLAVGQTLSGSGVTSGTKITNLLTGTGGTGKYAVDKSQTVAPSTSITATGGTLTVTAVGAGALGLGDVLLGAGVTAGNTITAFITGTGDTGTYLVSVGDAVSSETITTAGADVGVVYDSVSGAFEIVSGTTGANSSVTFGTGTIAASLKLTLATGAAVSPGAAAAAPGAFMDSVVQVTQNWATFTTLFNPDSGDAIANRLAFAAWANAQNDRYVYVAWDTSAEPTASVPATGSLGYAVDQAKYSGTSLNYEPTDLMLPAFVCGVVASIDFLRANGRITAAFKSQDGLTAGVSDATSAANLLANGYNYYGAYAMANQSWVFYNNGSISGEFLWLDSYVNQIWLNNSFVISLMDLLTTENSIPYNAEGDALIEAALADDIAAALNAGVARGGVTLSSSQIAEVNEAAGTIIAPVLQARGWYLQVQPTAPSVRQLRGSPPITFWYVDGESVQKVSLASILLQ